MLLAEARFENRVQGVAGMPLLLLAAVFTALLLLVLLPLLHVVRAAAGFLEKHQDEVKGQGDGSRLMVTPRTLLLLLLLAGSIAAVPP